MLKEKSQLQLSPEEELKFKNLINSRDWRKVTELINKTSGYDDLRVRYSIDAVKKNDIEALKTLYKNGISNVPDEKIHILVHLAALTGLDFVETLHDNDCPLFNKDGLLLDTAISYKKYDIAEYLLSLDDEIEFPEGFLLSSGVLNESKEYYQEYLEEKQKRIEAKNLKDDAEAKTMQIFKQKKENIKSRNIPKINGIKI